MKLRLPKDPLPLSRIMQDKSFYQITDKSSTYMLAMEGFEKNLEDQREQ